MTEEQAYAGMTPEQIAKFQEQGRNIDFNKPRLVLNLVPRHETENQKFNRLLIERRKSLACERERMRWSFEQLRDWYLHEDPEYAEDLSFERWCFALFSEVSA